MMDIAKSDLSTVSVIISCWTEDRLRDIGEAIASVVNETRLGDEVLVVVDNNERLYNKLKATTPDTVLVMLHRGSRGLSATRNAAIREAKGDLVAFLDDDAVALAGWLKELKRPFADSRVMGVGGATELRWPDRRPYWMPVELEWVFGGGFSWIAPEPQEVRNPHGNNMCFRGNAFSFIGLFNPRAGRVGNGAEAGEEAEFCLRLRRAMPEARIFYQPRAAIVHKVSAKRTTLSYVLRRSFSEGVAKGCIVHEGGFRGPITLMPEKAYLSKLFRCSIPSRLLRFYRPENALQVLVLILCALATGAGYLCARLGFAFTQKREMDSNGSN
jgi:glycosyltransferase involved in cell wall biosynthesis